MDAEVTALEGKLSKARQVKQGMMSMLLTGEGEVGVGVNYSRNYFLNVSRRLVGKIAF